MGVILTQHIPDGTGRFLVLGQRREAQFAHGIDDAPLYRLQAIADMGQGPIHDHIHGVVEISLFGEGAQWQALHPIQAQFGITHDFSSDPVNRPPNRARGNNDMPDALTSIIRIIKATARRPQPLICASIPHRRWIVLSNSSANCCENRPGTSTAPNTIRQITLQVSGLSSTLITG